MGFRFDRQSVLNPKELEPNKLDDLASSIYDKFESSANFVLMASAILRAPPDQA